MLLPAAAPRGLNPEWILRGHRPDMGQVQPNRQVIGVASVAATPAVPARKSAGCETQRPCRCSHAGIEHRQWQQARRAPGRATCRTSHLAPCQPWCAQKMCERGNEVERLFRRLKGLRRISCWLEKLAVIDLASSASRWSSTDCGCVTTLIQTSPKESARRGGYSSALRTNRGARERGSPATDRHRLELGNPSPELRTSSRQMEGVGLRPERLVRSDGEASYNLKWRTLFRQDLCEGKPMKGRTLYEASPNRRSSRCSASSSR